MERINRTQLYFGTVDLLSRRSTCLRGNVGVVAVLDNRIVATGYNGSPKGLPHCDSKTCKPGEPCQNSIHAEANLVSFAARYGIALNGVTIYCSYLPCKKCAELLIQSGVKEIFYKYDYRDKSGLLLLNKCNIKTQQVKDI